MTYQDTEITQITFFVEYKLLINKVELFSVCNNILYDNKNNTTNFNFNIYICSRHND